MPETFTGILGNKEMITEDTMLFTLRLDRPMKFKAGQYARVSLYGSTMEDEQSYRYLTMASPPEEPTDLSFVTKTGTSPFKRFLEKARTGAKLIVEGPRGRFVPHRETKVPTVFVAGGIGITPFRSMLQHFARIRTKRNITVFYIYDSRENAAFLNEMENISGRRNVSVIEILARDSLFSGDLADQVSRIRDRLGTDFDSSIFYVCGPPLMVVSTRSELLEMGVSADNLKIESFPGY